MSRFRYGEKHLKLKAEINGWAADEILQNIDHIDRYDSAFTQWASTIVDDLVPGVSITVY